MDRFAENSSFNSAEFGFRLSSRHEISYHNSNELKKIPRSTRSGDLFLFSEEGNRLAKSKIISEQLKGGL